MSDHSFFNCSHHHLLNSILSPSSPCDHAKPRGVRRQHQVKCKVLNLLQSLKSTPSFIGGHQLWQWPTGTCWPTAPCALHVSLSWSSLFQNRRHPPTPSSPFSAPDLSFPAEERHAVVQYASSARPRRLQETGPQGIPPRGRTTKGGLGYNRNRKSCPGKRGLPKTWGECELFLCECVCVFVSAGAAVGWAVRQLLYCTAGEDGRISTLATQNRGRVGTWCALIRLSVHGSCGLL